MNSIMNATWTIGRNGAALETNIDGHTVELWLDGLNGQTIATIVVDHQHTTDDSNEWDAVAAVFPRTYWPEPIYRGKQWDNKPRTAPAALVEAIAAYQANLDNLED